MGSLQAATTTGDSAAFRERYTPFGEAIVNTASNDNLAGFTGHIKDKATGLNYMQARYYDPVIGRFLSVDPVTFMDTGLPGQFNRYAYTWNDPINANDPDGEFLNFVAKFVVDVGLEVAIQAASGQDINLGAAAKGAALGVLDPTKTARKVAKLGKLANTARKANKTCCFVAGTLVETEFGLRPIEEIELGDKVLARNPITGETTLKSVTDLIRLNERQIWEVSLSGNNDASEFFETTDDHPWWVVDADGNGSWKDTAELSVGMIVTTSDDQTMIITKVVETNRIDATYNLTIADFETYFVGENKVLVHNCKKNLTTGNSNPDLGGGTDFTKIDAPSANLKSHPKLNTETRAPDSDFGGMATKARLDAASNLDAEFTPAAVVAIGVDKAVKTVKKCIDKFCGN